MNTPAPTPSPQAAAPAPPPRSGAWAAVAGVLRGAGWFGHWLPGAVLALLLGAGVAAWIWAGQDGSLPRALGWAQAWLDDPDSTTGQLQADGAHGSLRGGGTVQTLRWTRQGLDVQAHGLTLRWHSTQLVDALLLRRLHIDTLHIDQLRVDDQRAPQPDTPLQTLTLPLPVDLPWTLDRLTLTGRRTLQLDGLRGHYRYRPVEDADRQAWGPTPAAVTDAHHLRLDALTLAQGHYQAEAVLGAQWPLPLHVAALGRVQATVPEGERLDLQAAASAHGTLAGTAAALAVQAHVLPAGHEGTPPLAASAHLQPGAEQPLRQIDLQTHALDLAWLWPQAPHTALSGPLRATAEGGVWRAHLDLRNTRSGPWDRQRLPLDRLQGSIEHDGPLWRITDLQATLGPARLQGQGHYRPAAGGQPAQWQGQLQANAINPAHLWSAMAPARWDLRASAQPQAKTPDTLLLDAQLQSTGDAADPLRLRALRLQGQWRAAPSGGRLHIDQAHLDIAQAQWQAQGLLDLTARRFDGSSTLQLPGAHGRLNGVLAAADGQGSLTLEVDAIDRLLDWSQSLRRLPLVGERLGQMLAEPLQQAGPIQGRARLQAQWRGGLAPASRATAGPAPVPLQADITLEVPELNRRPSPGAAGWALRALQLHASGRADDLLLQLRGQARQGGWTAALQTQGRAQGLWPWPAATGAAARLQLQTLDLNAQHSPNRAPATAWALRAARPLVFTGRGSGSALVLQADPGQLLLQARSAPAAPTVPPPAPDAPGITGAPLNGEVQLAWDSLAWQGGQLSTRGRLDGLPLVWLDALGRTYNAVDGPLTRAGLGGNLLLGGTWDVHLPLQTSGTPRLQVQLQHRSGDLLLRTETGDLLRASARQGGTHSPPDPAPADTPRLAAGVRDARLDLSAQDGTLQARLRWDSERLGQVRADLASTLEKRAALGDATALERWWPASTPWQGTLSARLPQVGVWSALAPPGWRMRGTLQLDATLGGSRSAPDWRGTLQADQLALRSVVDGFEFSQGVLRASLSGERITVDRFELQGALGGSLSATGQAQWTTAQGQRQPQIDLQVQARQLRVSNRADRRLTLSGQMAAQLAGPRLTLRGQLTADSAQFVLPDENTPRLDDDVVVRGGRQRSPGPAEGASVQPDVAIALDLGPQFDVRGRGLQARLTGQLELRSTPAQPAPRVLGTVRTASGSYRAYGQQLRIETGELAFNGPFDDPSLNVLAMRPLARETEQRVGVQISGSAQAPRVRLVATPELPDAEKLAWLVLGRPATGAGAEAAILQQAALALLAGNDDTLNSGLAGALGLDELSVRGESLNPDGSPRAAAVTLGKRLSHQLYLSYETGLASAIGTVSVFYDLSRRFTLRARAGEENAIDLIFNWQYN